MGQQAPDRVSKIKAHLSKASAAAVGLSEEWRRGNEIVGQIARGLADRAYEPGPLTSYKQAFVARAKLAKAVLVRLDRSVLFLRDCRDIWKEHSRKPKVP